MGVDGWHADPSGRHEERLFSRGEPTALVRDGGVGSYDETGPTPGTPTPSPATASPLAPSPRTPAPLVRLDPVPKRIAPPRHDIKARVPRNRRLLLVLAVAACVAGTAALASAVALGGSKSPGSTPSTPTRTLTTSVTTPSSAPGSVPQASTTLPVTIPPASSSPTTTPSAASAIGQSFATVFDFANGVVTDKLDAIADGSTLQQAMTEAVTSSFASSALGARIDTYTMLDGPGCTKVSLAAPCAQVTYDILGTGGSAILSGSLGYAVSVNGRWLVAKGTVCTLFGLLYEASGKTGTPPGC